MEEKTADEVAAIFAAAGDSVTVIGIAKTDEETTDEYKDRIKRNVEHLEIEFPGKGQDSSGTDLADKNLWILIKLGSPTFGHNG
jgi:hypothetical protein